MSEVASDASVPPTGGKGDRRPYAAPQIVWREPYEPVSFAVSCALVPALPACNSGPVVA